MNVQPYTCIRIFNALTKEIKRERERIWLAGKCLFVGMFRYYRVVVTVMQEH